MLSYRDKAIATVDTPCFVDTTCSVVTYNLITVVNSQLTADATNVGLTNTLLHINH